MIVLSVSQFCVAIGCPIFSLAELVGSGTDAPTIKCPALLARVLLPLPPNTVLMLGTKDGDLGIRFS